MYSKSCQRISLISLHLLCVKIQTNRNPSVKYWTIYSMLFIYYCMIYDEFHSLFDKRILIFLSFSHPTFAFWGCPERQTIQPLRRKHSHGPWHLRCAAKRETEKLPVDHFTPKTMIFCFELWWHIFTPILMTHYFWEMICFGRFLIFWFITSHQKTNIQ